MCILNYGIPFLNSFGFMLVFFYSEFSFPYKMFVQLRNSCDV